MRLIFNEYLSWIPIYHSLQINRNRDNSFVRNIIPADMNVRFVWGIMGRNFFSDLAIKVKGVIPGFINGKFLLLTVRGKQIDRAAHPCAALYDKQNNLPGMADYFATGGGRRNQEKIIVESKIHY